MKSIFYFFIIVFSVNLNAQESQNSLKSSIGLGHAPNSLRTDIFEIEYQRHFACGVNVIAGYITANGGIGLDKLFNAKDLQLIIDATRTSRFSSQSGSPLGSHYSFSGFKLGLQKSIVLTSRLKMGVSIAAQRLKISESSISNISYDENNILLVEELMTKFATYSKFSAEVAFLMEHKITSFVSAGASIKYHTSTQFIIPNTFIIVTF